MFRKTVVPALIILAALYTAGWYGLARHLELNVKLELEKIKQISAVEKFEYKKVHITGFPLGWKMAIEAPELKLNLKQLKKDPKTHPFITHTLVESGFEHLTLTLAKSKRVIVAGNIFKPKLTIKSIGPTKLDIEDGKFKLPTIEMDNKEEIIELTFAHKSKKEDWLDYTPLLAALQSFHINDIQKVELKNNQTVTSLGQEKKKLLAKTQSVHAVIDLSVQDGTRKYHIVSDYKDMVYTQALIDLTANFQRHFLNHGRIFLMGNTSWNLVENSPENAHLDATLSMPKNYQSKGMLDFPHPIQLTVHDYQLNNPLGKTSTQGKFHIKREKELQIIVDADFTQKQQFDKQAKALFKSHILRNVQQKMAQNEINGPQYVAYAEQFLTAPWLIPNQLDNTLKLQVKLNPLANELDVQIKEYTLKDATQGFSLSGQLGTNGPILAGKLRFSLLNHEKSVPTLLRFIEHLNQTHQQSNCLCLQFTRLPFIELPKTFQQDATKALYTLASNEASEKNLFIDIGLQYSFSNQNQGLQVHIKDKNLESWLPKLSLMRNLKRKHCLQVWDKLASANHPNAQFNLGRYHLNFRKDYATALKYFQAAHDKKHPLATFKLALMYQNGLGVKKDLTKAAQYMQEAAQLGCGVAQNELGVFYERGIGVKRDLKKARHWYVKAEQQLLRSATINLWQINRPLQNKTFVVAQGPTDERVVCHEYNKKSIEQMAKMMSMLGWSQVEFLPEGQPDAIPTELRLYAAQQFNQHGIQVSGYEPPKTGRG